MPGVSDATKVFLSIVMLIGGGSTSTAGGIRVTTFAVILLTCRAAFTGRHDVNAFHRRIHSQSRHDGRGRHHLMSGTHHHSVHDIDGHHRMLAEQRAVRHLLGVRSGRLFGGGQRFSPAVLYILAATMFIGRPGPLNYRLRDLQAAQCGAGPLPHRADRGRLSGFVDTVSIPALPILESGTEHRKVREQSWLTTPEAFLW